MHGTHLITSTVVHSILDEDFYHSGSVCTRVCATMNSVKYLLIKDCSTTCADIRLSP